MCSVMEFPEDITEFLLDCSIVDTKEIYTNGSRLVPFFRVQQALGHYYPKKEEKNWKWLSYHPYWKCSKCSYLVNWYNNTPYCPNCGAKMMED